MTDAIKPVEVETQRMDKLNAIYAQEPWGKLAIECGFNPYHTESMAREAFRLCAEKIAALNERVERLEAALTVPRVWTDEESASLQAAFNRSNSKHGFYETLFAIAAESLRLAQKRAAALERK